MVMVSLVTPGDVAPPLPLDSSQNATHGGDCGSSICRGGLPTQRFTLAGPGVGTVVGGAVVVVASAPPAPVPLPSPAPHAAPGGQSPAPVPDPNWLACSFGESLICSTAWGANSAMAGGGGWRMVRVTATRRAAMPRVSPSCSRAGPRGRRFAAMSETGAGDVTFDPPVGLCCRRTACCVGAASVIELQDRKDLRVRVVGQVAVPPAQEVRWVGDALPVRPDCSRGPVVQRLEMDGQGPPRLGAVVRAAAMERPAVMEAHLPPLQQDRHLLD